VQTTVPEEGRIGSVKRVWAAMFACCSGEYIGMKLVVVEHWRT
jgi:hypothetical protein